MKNFSDYLQIIQEMKVAKNLKAAVQAVGYGSSENSVIKDTEESVTTLLRKAYK
jgi:hypothetical protein